MSGTVDRILAGAVDLNVLAGPEPDGRLRFDALDTGRHAQEAGLAGFLLLSNDFPTMSQAQILNRVYPGLTVQGSITLNSTIGRLNAEAVNAAAAAGAAAVLLSDVAGEPQSEVSLLDGSGSINRDAGAMLDILAGRDVIVMSGGLSHEGTVAVFEELRRRGVKRMVLSQSSDCVNACDHGARAAALGAYVEHSFAACMPGVAETSPARLAENVRAATVEASVLTSGFGQWYNPSPAEGLRMAIAAMLAEGLEPCEVETLVKHNPTRLLSQEN